MIQLGGNIELAGFKEIDGGNMIIIKKMVGNFVKDVSEMDPRFQKLTITLKKVHQHEDHQIFDLQAKLTCEDVYNADMEDRNLLVAVDKVLKKLESQMHHRLHK
jgi:ribosome-associated translation inhibitor RaiA